MLGGGSYARRRGLCSRTRGGVMVSLTSIQYLLQGGYNDWTDL